MLKNPAPQIYCFFLIVVLFSCSRRERVDVSHINVKVSIERFDKALDSLNSGNILQKNSEWLNYYGTFYADYMQYILEAGDPRDTVQLASVLERVIATDDFKALKASVYDTYPSMEAQETGLTDAFKHLKYYFPAIDIPRFVAFFSGFAVQTPIGEDYIGIGLDMFLGADSKFYPALRESIPYYLARRFTPENIVPRVTESYIREELFPQQELDVSLLQHMVYQGKVLYVMERAMPDVADSLKIGYTSQQWEWANRFERDIWAWILQENLLYETDYNRIQKYLGEAPFTPELGDQNESAPKLGIFIGWQIVRKYMERHPETTLTELLGITDAQAVLDGGRYRGR
ncbi:gliding motility lipoprotein GldB [Parapedobacter koreensis]|uniref:Gliding motility-associated lipoprotein GldB n=1 Tax=Parapedobacter koreensis TaxID=332977 RepID=A0A1H7F6I3_9SPHI|nr:gliding motility lipoprotein GldB [Parapedobacter koreensis]SEK18785.1 gliding motility-associated lipoprotein GldB [Parapedobacter koreensis]